MNEFRILTNPVAGGGKALDRARAAAARLEARGVRAGVQIADSAARLVAGAREAVGAGRRLLVCGGDGTIAAVAGMLADLGVTGAYHGAPPPGLGIIPGGRGNDFARCLGIPLDPRAAADLAIDGADAAVDLGRVGTRWYCTVAMAGFDAEVALRTAAAGPGLSRLGYVSTALRCLPAYRPTRIRLTGDFGVLEGRYFLAAAGNGASYGGGMRIVPGASVSDGLLHLCVVRAAAWPRVLPLLALVYRGLHVHSPLVHTAVTRSVTIETDHPIPVVGDGEPAGRTPIRIEAHAGAIRVFLPRERVNRISKGVPPALGS